MCKMLFRPCEGTNSFGASALGSAASQTIAQEKPPPLWVRSQGKESKDSGVGLPQAPKTEVVGHSSLSERHGSTNGHGTAQERSSMDGCSLSSIPCPLRYSPSRSHAAFLRIPTTREWKKPLPLGMGRVSQCSMNRTRACAGVRTLCRKD
jgi:hypothetical protein